LNINGATS
jgi:hypothetical protein